MVWQMAKVVLFTLTVTYMKVSGKIKRHMDLVLTAILMVLNLLGIGKRTNKMEMELKLGLMEPNMRVNTFKDRNMDKAISYGMMVAFL